MQMFRVNAAYGSYDHAMFIVAAHDQEQAIKIVKENVRYPFNLPETRFRTNDMPDCTYNGSKEMVIVQHEALN